MKKALIILACSMMLPMAMQAKKSKSDIKTYKDCYIYAQSGRNSAKKGSAMSLSSGMTYSLQNASDVAGTKDIDVILFFGKANKGKSPNAKVFHFFAPNDPTITIDWEKDGGTTPYCKYEGKSDDPDAEYALKNWKQRNATKMEKVTNVDFDNATFETLDALTLSESYIASDIKVGDVIAFQLADTSSKPGKKGLMKVTAIENDEEKPDQAGNGQYQRLIVTIKIQK